MSRRTEEQSARILAIHRLDDRTAIEIGGHRLPSRPRTLCGQYVLLFGNNVPEYTDDDTAVTCPDCIAKIVLRRLFPPPHAREPLHIYVSGDGVYEFCFDGFGYGFKRLSE